MLEGTLAVKFQIMNQSIVIGNVALSRAYQHFQEGQLELALQEYQKALKNTFPQDLKTNIKCTMAIVQQALGRYDRAGELLGSKGGSKQPNGNNTVRLRVCANLTMFNILEGRYTKALQHFGSIMEVIQREEDLQSKQSLLRFVTYLFFRVEDLDELSQAIQNMDVNGMRAQELYCLSLMAFNSQICKQQCQQKIQKLCYQQFSKQKRYDLAIFSLRSLIFFTKNMVNRQSYEKELGKLVMMGHFGESVDFLNYQPYEVVEAIMEQFSMFRLQVHEEIAMRERRKGQGEENKVRRSNDSELVVQWKYAITLIEKELYRGREMQEVKQQIMGMLGDMRLEKNPMVIRSLIKNNYFHKYYQRAQKHLRSIALFVGQRVRIIEKFFFQRMVKFVAMMPNVNDKSLLRSEQKKVVVKHDRSKSFTRVREQKENYPPLGISVVTITSSKVSQGRRKIFEDNFIQQTHKKMLKMVRICEYGSFLNKRNYNSEGGQFKFVKITNSFIKWGKDPQKIQSSCQIYPLKDIRGIVYGRVSPNLNQTWNKMLNYENCFSLLLQKRTLDFYCKNYDQLQAWVCGLSHVLKKDGSKMVGYSAGRLRWKKMFAILRGNFIEPLKVTERHKYYYENAYALKLFAQNGYQLPSKTTVKR